MNERRIQSEQQIITDKDFEYAIKEETFVKVMQSGMQIRPVSTIAGYSQAAIRMKDGSIVHRNANSFFAIAE
ncbi:hypothetical protein KP806_19820 [Paenibacillus sp. N4]|uniref:hypothetical protein n=1 Tax=Paenibacillus vietnamensis TaxID=2590547 RepID=UPI001CD0DD61|nr:hypothetical protein [Paenibacillus vietnamensis]MCA0757309.1 hypothetical protein [Paenibacillus vietnamensis]